MNKKIIAKIGFVLTDINLVLSLINYHYNNLYATGIFLISATIILIVAVNLYGSKDVANFTNNVMAGIYFMIASVIAIPIGIMLKQAHIVSLSILSFIVLGITTYTLHSSNVEATKRKDTLNKFKRKNGNEED